MDMIGRFLELSQQKYIRKILYTFEQYIPTTMVERTTLEFQPRQTPAYSP